MEPISFIGVLIGLATTIYLIIKKLNPAVSMFLGAIIGYVAGSLISGTFYLSHIVPHIIIGVEPGMGGASSMTGVVVRIMAGGVLAGALIESGAAESIARGIVNSLGEKRALAAIALSSMVIVSVGVFIPVSVIVLAPIALSVAQKSDISKFATILALSGGAKAGNIISPNPNSIAAAAFPFGGSGAGERISELGGVHGLGPEHAIGLSDIMIGGFVPAVATIIFTIFIVGKFKNNNAAGFVTDADMADIEAGSNLPPFSKAIIAPATAIFLLMLTPLGNIFGIEALARLDLDAFLVLPFAAFVGSVAMGKHKDIIDFTTKGVLRMAPVCLMLIGAGALSGLILNSDFPAVMANSMLAMGIPSMFLAPLSGTIMATATGSAAAGVIVSVSAFGEILLQDGLTPLAAGVMINAGSNFLDYVPHGNYFLAGQQSMKVSMVERMKVMPWEALIGAVLTITAVVIFGIL